MSCWPSTNKPGQSTASQPDNLKANRETWPSTSPAPAQPAGGEGGEFLNPVTVCRNASKQCGWCGRFVPPPPPPPHTTSLLIITGKRQHCCVFYLSSDAWSRKHEGVQCMICTFKFKQSLMGFGRKKTFAKQTGTVYDYIRLVF